MPNNGVEVDPEKINAVKDMKNPHNIKQLWRYWDSLDSTENLFKCVERQRNHFTNSLIRAKKSFLTKLAKKH